MGFRLTQNEMTLATFLAGGVLTQGGAWLQRRWRRQDDVQARQEQREHDAAERHQARTDAACDAALTETLAIAQLVRLRGDASAVVHHVATIERNLLLLGDAELRERMRACAVLLLSAESVAPRAAVSSDLIKIEACEAIVDVVGALIRREPVPPPLEWFEDRVAMSRAVVRETREAHERP